MKYKETSTSDARRRPGRAIVAGGVLVLLALLASACNGGSRPTLVAGDAPTPEPPLQLDLPPAPDGTPPLPGGSADAPWEASVDDALIAWARDRAVDYLDRCSLATPGPNQYCDVETARETVRLLGPTADESWYIVTLEQNAELTFGTGYRVSTVTIVE